MPDREAGLIDRIRRGYDAYSRGDFDGAAENMHSDVELVRAGDQPPIRGIDRLRDWMEPDAFESQVLEPLDFRVAADKVLIRLRSTVRGSGSGIEAEFMLWTVYTVDEAGRTTRIEIFLDHQEADALRAAGLEE